MRSVRCTHGGEACVELHTILLMVSGDTNFLAICFDEESHEETAEGVSSINPMMRSN